MLSLTWLSTLKVRLLPAMLNNVPPKPLMFSAVPSSAVRKEDTAPMPALAMLMPWPAKTSASDTLLRSAVIEVAST